MFTKIVNLMTFLAEILVLGRSHMSYSQKYKEMMIKKKSTKIVNFMTLGAQVLVLAYGAWPYREEAVFLLLLSTFGLDHTN